MERRPAQREQLVFRPNTFSICRISLFNMFSCLDSFDINLKKYVSFNHDLSIVTIDRRLVQTRVSSVEESGFQNVCQFGSFLLSY